MHRMCANLFTPRRNSNNFWPSGTEKTRMTVPWNANIKRSVAESVWTAVTGSDDSDKQKKSQ